MCLNSNAAEFIDIVFGLRPVALIDIFMKENTGLFVSSRGNAF